MSENDTMTAEVVVDRCPAGLAAMLIVRDINPNLPDIRAWGALNPTERDLAQLERIADRINGIGDPRAAKLDLRPIRKFDWTDKLLWAWVGFLACGIVETLVKRL